MAIVNFMIRGRFGYTVRTLESSERYALAVLKLLITGSFLVSCGSAISQASVIMFRVMLNCLGIPLYSQEFLSEGKLLYDTSSFTPGWAATRFGQALVVGGMCGLRNGC